MIHLRLLGFSAGVNSKIVLLNRHHQPGIIPKHSKRQLNDDDYNLQKKQRQKRIDTILDKISKSGYESLTKEEKEFLFRMSNNK